MANDFTITVRVDTTTTPETLTYTGAGPGGSTNGAKSHKILREAELFFMCPDGDLLIHFKGDKKPFKNPNAADVMVQATAGNNTPKLTVKKVRWGKRVRYTAVVAKTAGGMIAEDPELEDGGGGGGGGGQKKKKTVSKKKVAKKKTRKR